MTEIILEYHPFPFFSFTRKIAGSFPSSITELSSSQLVAVARLANLSISETEFLHFMTGIRKFRINLLLPFHRFSLMELFSSFTDITSHNSFIIPHISTSIGYFFAPEPKLAGFSIARFIFAESFLLSYQIDNNPVHLHKFIACLYLPEDVTFSEKIITPGALLLAKTKPEILQAVVLNYTFVKEWLCLAYPIIFVRPDSDTQDKKPAQKKYDNSAWLKIFESIVGDDIINYDKYAQMPIHTVFRWMTNKMKENMKRK